MIPLVEPHSSDWVNNLGSKNKYPDKEHASIIHNLRRDDIFRHKYTAENIFDHIYENSSEKAKRQPNPFMMFRTVLGLVAHNKNVKLGDGTLQSKLAGIIWAGASQEEKKKFEDLAADFRSFEEKRTQQSKLAGLVWGGASQEEKKKFESLAADFRSLENKRTPEIYI
jgi:hypothetical protein